MSSSSKKVKKSGERLIRLSPRPDGLRLRDTNVLFKRSEIEWLVKRAGNLENILEACRRSPEDLLAEVQGLIEAQGASHAAADRSIEAMYHYQLAILLGNLKTEFRRGTIRGHKEFEELERRANQTRKRKAAKAT